MSSCELVISLREKVSPGWISSSLRSCASGTTMVPASLMSETLYTSPGFDVDGDEHVVLLGRDRDLRRVDLEVGVAAVHVVGAQLLQDRPCSDSRE